MQTRREFLEGIIVTPAMMKLLGSIGVALTFVPGCAEGRKKHVAPNSPLDVLLRAKGSNVMWYTYHGQTTTGVPLDGAFVQGVDGHVVITYDLDGVFPTTGVGELPSFGTWKRQTWYDALGQPVASA